MELFSVKRYKDESATDHKEKDNLQTLLQKIEKRKKKKAVAIEQEEAVQKRKKDEPDNEKSPGQDTIPNATNALAEDPISADIEEDTDTLTAAAPPAAGFEVLGDDSDFKKRPQVVEMVLPDWLAHPTVISTQINAEDDAEQSLPAFLAPHIRTALKEMNITRLFPVQDAVIPWILDAHTKPAPYRPRDICVSAPTGSGKTLAFAVPVVQLLAKRVERRIRALVVLPVAELALQVFKVFKRLCEKTDLTVCLLSKQFPLALEQERLVELYKGRYHSKVDIVVTTPGRLVDHLHSTKGFCLKALKYLVIDEADRIMDAVFQNWLYHLDEHVRTASDQLLSGRAGPLCYNELLMVSSLQPHKLLFSATLSQDPEKLQNLRLFQPKLFTSVLADLHELRANLTAAQAGQAEESMRGEFIGKYTTPAELTEKYCITESRLKPLTLFSLIQENEWRKFLCFTNSAESASRLAFVLSKLFAGSVSISELSAQLTAKHRATVLSQLAAGKINGLICSDALARGIDIPEVDVVISYDPPRHMKTYIHRIGRTARAGRQGTAITLLNQTEFGYFNKSLAEVGKASLTNAITVSADTEERNANAYTKVLSELRNHLEQTKRTKQLRKEQAKSTNMLKKAPEQMTLMEKLQAQIDADTLKKATAAEGPRAQKKSLKFNRKKLKLSAGKNHSITQ